MLGPPQNININISYNLANDKPSKGVMGRKILKSGKINHNLVVPHEQDIKHRRTPMEKKSGYAYGSCDFGEKDAAKKNNQNILYKSNEPKKQHDKHEKKSKKKVSCLQRHTLTPDLFVNERKARTEHIQTETDLGITISKKESKYASRFFAAHHKSTNLAPAKFAFSGKKGASSSKMSKHKAQHMNSCMLYNSKKNNVELLEQPVVAVPQEIRKRRTLSAVVIKNDRVVSKLLNMSLLTSELGGSQLVTSERRESQKTQHRALKDYMSSIDLKMILKMEMDVQISRQPGNFSQEIIKSLVKHHQISLEELTQKAILIQRAWRNKQRNSVMGLYQNLFQAATKNFNKENYASVGSFRYKKDLEKNSQSHGRIAHERVEPLVFRNGKKRLDQSDSMDSNDSSELFMPVQMFQNHAVKLGIRNNSQASEEDNSASMDFMDFSKQKKYPDRAQNDQREQHDQQGSAGDHSQQRFPQHMRWVDRFDSDNSEDPIDIIEAPNAKYTAKEPSLNIPKYKQLVISTIKQSQQSQKKNLSQFKEEQVEQWNNINKKISSIMNERGPMQSKALLDELIKQSNYNKKWIQEEFVAKEKKVEAQCTDRMEGTDRVEGAKSNEKEEVSEGAEYGKRTENIPKGVSGEENNDSGNVSPTSQKQDQDVLVRNIVEVNDEIDHAHVAQGKCQPSVSKETLVKPNESHDQNRKQSCLSLAKQDLSECNLPIPLRPVKGANDDCFEPIRIYKDEDSLSESSEYDRGKYIQSQVSPGQDGSVKGGPHESLDQQWISKQIMLENDVVRNYLDCGLDDFGLPERQHQQPFGPEQESTHDRQVLNVAPNYPYSPQSSSTEFYSPQKHFDASPQIRVPHAQQYGEAIIEYLTSFMICEFAEEISKILRKSTQPQDDAMGYPGSSGSFHLPGIPTSLQYIKDYTDKFIAYISNKSQALTQVIENINKDIGPTSLQILSYMRPDDSEYNDEEYFDDYRTLDRSDSEQGDQSDIEGMFIAPAELAAEFEMCLREEYVRENNGVQISAQRAIFYNLWNRCIFEAFNECLDYERPYGIEGKPYQWSISVKSQLKRSSKNIQKHLRSAQKRLLDNTSFVCGIIFEKDDSFLDSQYNQEQRHSINEQRLSRLLANQLWDTQSSFIKYDDELAELLVELSRLIEESLFFEMSAGIRKLHRMPKPSLKEDRKEQPKKFEESRKSDEDNKRFDEDNMKYNEDNRRFDEDNRKYDEQFQDAPISFNLDEL